VNVPSRQEISPARPQYEVGPFRIDAARRRLIHGTTQVPVTPKVFDLLLTFVENPGEILTKDALVARLWPNTVVEDNNLTHAIAKLRKALGDDIREHRFIVTVPGEGYRFVAPVRETAGRLERAGSRMRESGPHEPARVSRLMVLPFRILRPSPDTDFLAFSLPDAITSTLSGFQSLVVRSSAAAAQFATDQDPPDLETIAVKADVDAVLHGTLLEGGDEVRVSAQLVRVPDGTVLWSGTAQSARGDVFALQDTLTRHIVDGLAVRLTERDHRALRHDVPSSGHAYELYLRANQLSYDVRHFALARDLYMQSLDEDSRFAPAWARLGRVYRVTAKYTNQDTATGYTRAESAFGRALELNPDLAVAHGLYAYLEADLGRAQDAMVRLLSRPETARDSELLAGLVHACRYCGLLDESVAAHNRARVLDPTIRTSVAQTYWALGQYSATIEADLDSPSFISILAVEALGRKREAIALATGALNRPTVPETARMFISAFRAMFEGEIDESILKLEDVRRLTFPDPEAFHRQGWMLARLGHVDPALEFLRRATNGGFVCPFDLQTNQWFEPLRLMPAFQDILDVATRKQRTARDVFAAMNGDALVGL
jgi:DNA-binding winged helix-turn-helix (wHTH) protein